MGQPFQCRCGTVRGQLEAPRRGVRAVCYCGDCQAYAHLLGEPRLTLDPLGGTDVVATQARHVRFTAGTGALACLSLSPRGLLRWYAGCCKTPLLNTPRDWKLPYVGVVHTCLGPGLADAVGPVQLHVNTGRARGPVPAGRGPLGWTRFAGLVARLTAARLAGGYRQTPLFTAEGAPVVPVRVAPREAVEAARQAVSAG